MMKKNRVKLAVDGKSSRGRFSLSLESNRKKEGNRTMKQQRVSGTRRSIVPNGRAKATLERLHGIVHTGMVGRDRNGHGLSVDKQTRRRTERGEM